jgi:cytochrome c-type biogenesis protein CcmH
MTLWFLMTLVLVGAAALLCWPFLRRPKLADGASADIYKAQLAEIDREEAAGLMSAEDARMGRTEVQRRLIATTGASATLETPDMTLTDRTTFIAVAAALAVGSAVLYMAVGSPGAGLASHPPVMMGQMNGQSTQGMPMAAAGAAGAGGQMTGVAPVDEMIATLEARLVSQPNDAEGWRMLGWSKFRTDDYAGAAVAYGKAIAITPNDAETQSAYGESLSRASGGLVTEEAAKALQAALKVDPQDARARFLLGLQKEQTGQPAKALDDWIAMLASAPADAPWFDEVRGRAVELSQSSGIDITKRLPAARGVAGAPTIPLSPETMTADAARPAGPTAADVSAAAAMTPEARQAMIDGMVSRLETRLRDNPNDLDGWLKLIRSHRVMGQNDRAARALADGKIQFAKDRAAQLQLDAAMTESLN